MFETGKPVLIPVRAYAGWVQVPETSWCDRPGAPVHHEGIVLYPGYGTPDFSPPFTLKLQPLPIRRACYHNARCITCAGGIVARKQRKLASSERISAEEKLIRRLLSTFDLSLV